MNSLLSEAHVTENKSSGLHLNKDNQICSSSNPVLPHDGSSQLVTCCHGPVATRATMRAIICCTVGSSGTLRCWFSIRFHYHHGVNQGGGKAREQQLCQRRTALNSLSRIFHIKHLYSVSRTPNFYSALKTCNCDVCEKPGV